MTLQAQLPFVAQPRPFLKWAGGKRLLVPELLRRLPPKFDRYFEPFVGAGALFFAATPDLAVLGDMNARLIRCYRAIRDAPEEVIATLAQYPNDKAFFLAQRERDIDSSPDADVAAWMLFLNRTGYNGLYRVNRDGKFNVPFGRYARPRICDPDNLRACSIALRSAEFVVSDFHWVEERAQRGDFVYFDPPYVPMSRYSDFSRYTPGGFSSADQQRLRDVAAALKGRGVHVLVSNSDTPEVRRLYSSDFEITVVKSPRFINSRGTGRGHVSELLIQ